MLRSAAIGGGSIAATADGELKLGPASQGAIPGPACYDLGGREATLTDALVVTGMLNPKRFLGGRRELRVNLAQDAIRRRVAEPLGIGVEEAAARIVDRAAGMVAELARQTLADASLTPDGFKAFCFGGNGANFAVPVSERLGLESASAFSLGPVLSAFGSSVAEICHLHEQWPYLDLTSKASVTPSRRSSTGLRERSGATSRASGSTSMTPDLRAR